MLVQMPIGFDMSAQGLYLSFDFKEAHRARRAGRPALKAHPDSMPEGWKMDISPFGCRPFVMKLRLLKLEKPEKYPGNRFPSAKGRTGSMLK